MGLFRDVRKLSAVAREAQRDVDPAAQMREARTQMQMLTAQTQLSTSPTALRSPATVVAIRDTHSMVNQQALFECDVTVRPAGGIPFATTVTVMGAARLMMLQPGNAVTVAHEPGDTERVVLL